MKQDWNLKSNVYDSKLSVNDMVSAIEVFEKIQHKYPDDEYIEAAIEILRNEICIMFGGTIYI